MANYRGIAVMCAPAKCLAIILERKLSAFLEAHNLRAPGQFGFRRNTGTHLALFVMRHLQASVRRSGAAVLYVCLVDFAKAFDTVQRPLLWETLCRLGLSGRLLSAVQCLYSSVRMRVKLQGKVGEVFESLLGVKQGDPLSPVLFGAFIEVLPAFMVALNRVQTLVPDVFDRCPDIDGLVLFYLLFADDLTLLTRCSVRLQHMLNFLSLYCEIFGMTVNTNKTEILVFGTRAAVAAATATPLTYNNLNIRFVPSARYLGMHFDSRDPKAAEPVLRAAATRARFSLQRDIRRLAPLPPATQVHLFDALVRPVLMYGAQVWGAEYLRLPPPRPPDSTTYDFAPQTPLDAVVYAFLRFVSDTGRSAPSWVLLQEFSVLPLQSHLATCILRMWNSLRDAARSDTVAAHAARADLRLMLLGDKRCWSYKVCHFLASLSSYVPRASPIPEVHARPFLNGTAFPLDAFTYWWGLLVNVADVELGVAEFWRARVLSVVTGSPRTQPLFPKFTAYVAWVGVPPVFTKHAHLSCRLSRCAHVCLMRYRLGCWHFLGANAERTSSAPRRARADRLCTRCSAAVDDELHVFAECAALRHIRAAFPDLFPLGVCVSGDVRAVLDHPQQHRVADYLLRISRYCSPQ
jgi:hypothetical protein